MTAILGVSPHVKPHQVEGEPGASGSLVTFLLLTYFATWASWIAAWTIGRGASSGYPRPGLPMLLFWSVGLRWYAFALTYMAAIKLAAAPAITWLYAHTNGSLLLTMLMHAAINNTRDIVPSGGQAPGNPFALSGSSVGWLTLGLLWVCAGYFLVRMHNAGRQRV